jgi:hypothetical protein
MQSKIFNILLPVFYTLSKKVERELLVTCTDPHTHVSDSSSTSTPITLVGLGNLGDLTAIQIQSVFSFTK